MPDIKMSSQREQYHKTLERLQEKIAERLRAHIVRIHGERGWRGVIRRVAGFFGVGR